MFSQMFFNLLKVLVGLDEVVLGIVVVVEVVVFDVSGSRRFFGRFGKLKSGLVGFGVEVVEVHGIVVVLVGNVLVVVCEFVVVLVLSSFFGNRIGVGLFFIFENAFENINNKAEQNSPSSLIFFFDLTFLFL
ncbi:hypothetical protein F8M41_015761 [Gigaspora margarita]|uniref:Transmembrane protein n=1 Tax=Gigaspora margarita TaxID=4874 RepID=A0A8H3WVX9_GIGMA|nr:hypothetical protein F8M41_015761 [Gigaspora margarita]